MRIGPRDPAALPVAFVCNNQYHLSVCSEVARRLAVPCDLFLLGKQPRLARSPQATSPPWRCKVTWFSEGGGRALLRMPRSEVADFCRAATRDRYRVIVYFVDKEFSNQLLLRLHPHSVKVLVEEGVGLYVSGKPTWRDSLTRRLFAYKSTGHWLRFCGVEQGANRYHEHLVARYPDLVPREKKCRVQVHGFDIPLAATCDGSNCPSVPNGMETQRSKPVFLFVGSGVEVTHKGWLSVAEETRQLRDLFALFEERGFACYAKPHPREPEGRYRRLGRNVVELDDARPVELLAAHLKPQAAAAYMSTAILNLTSVRRRYYLHEWIPVDFPNKAVLRQLLPRARGIETPQCAEDLRSMMDRPSDQPLPEESTGARSLRLPDVLERLMVKELVQPRACA